jgi:N-acetylated-alpha-linked acidic dipeptidase
LVFHFVSPTSAAPSAEQLKLEARYEALLIRGTTAQRAEYRTRKNIRINALGSGSDYSAFLQHLGVASYNISFRGEGIGSEYHTCFDTFDHYTKNIDPGHLYGIALAQVCGRLTLRLSEAEILPFDFNAQAETIQRYIQKVVKLADTMREETEFKNQLIAEGRYKKAADPKRKYIQPQPEKPIPHINFAPLLNAGQNLQATAANFHKTLATKSASRKPARLKKLNQQIYQTERALVHAEGLPRRPWFRHQIYAPGFYTGYGVKTLPGICEALESRNWQETAEQIQITTAALKRLVEQLATATAVLEN